MTMNFNVNWTETFSSTTEGELILDYFKSIYVQFTDKLPVIYVKIKISL